MLEDMAQNETFTFWMHAFHVILMGPNIKISKSRSTRARTTKASFPDCPERHRLQSHSPLATFIFQQAPFRILSLISKHVFQGGPIIINPSTRVVPLTAQQAEIQTWAAALKAYDEEDFEKSLELFNVRVASHSTVDLAHLPQGIADSSKILTNMGLIYATLGEHETAVELFNAATSLDQYLAVGYFQCGVSNFLLARYELALTDFEEALLYLRGNQTINYEQLGLKFRLYYAEVLFNKGLSQVYLGRTKEGIQNMEEARGEMATEEHNVIDDAIMDFGKGHTVFSIPVGILYRPSENKLKNAVAKDYLGKAKLVVVLDPREAYTTFTGVTRLQRGMKPTGAPIDRPASDPGPDRTLARSATTTATPRVDDPGILPPKSALALSRNTTTINLVSLEEREDRLQAAAANAASTRSNTMSRGLSVCTPGGGQGGPLSARSPGGPLSVRSPGRPLRARSPGRNPSTPTQQNGPRSSPRVSGANNPCRLREICDDYINGYDNEEPPEVPPLPSQTGDSSKRVVGWARNNANPAAVRLGATTTSAYAPPPSVYASNFSGASVRRKLPRRPTYGGRSAGSGGRSAMYEEEEGYVSGDYDDGPFEPVKIRVKLHYKGDVRGMALAPETTFDEFVERVTGKFSKSLNGLGFKFKDEDGTHISLLDDSDYDLAMETARESTRGKLEGKLEIWCTDQ
ncbi:hypothetical protein JB92DRAFT_3134523 [Gautieria morchelliformis]|nr:hypothetical protein JB92DRAFT_3134523 [Gautieria morchelliformis]